MLSSETVKQLTNANPALISAIINGVEKEGLTEQKAEVVLNLMRKFLHGVKILNDTNQEWLLAGSTSYVVDDKDKKAIIRYTVKRVKTEVDKLRAQLAQVCDVETIEKEATLQFAPPVEEDIVDEAAKAVVEG